MNNVPRSEQFDDVYFSVEDGLAETRHVFLDGNNLPQAWQGKEHFTICETGFGTGLNFLAVLKLLKDNPVKLHYISIEKYPLSKEEIQSYLSVWEELSEELDMMLSVYPDGGQVGDVTLELHFADVNKTMPRLDQEVDCWFLDGFKPSSNPDMWTDNVFQNMARLSKKGSTFATFTSAGFVRRGLQDVGFDVRKVPGFGRKREMCVGIFKEARNEN
ncbi:MAG: tRNA (5-methylaminomethyl-2-thiouridine)(34)-methyltransferase MnmD [Alphaproteobacteria bacterium]|nr:tRNA (5-methylaminomethyl-2-thiouridine)(34)-methyltransferase MnmD [Alphaproteobacteria bacterium]